MAYAPVKAAVEEVVDLSPAFRRIVFGGPALGALESSRPAFDQRIKLVLPSATGELPPLTQTADWYQRWLSQPAATRGFMRTYSTRRIWHDARGTHLAVDFVMHDDVGAAAGHPGSSADSGAALVGSPATAGNPTGLAHASSPAMPAGPAVTWARNAEAGDELWIVGPLRGAPATGIEFEPCGAERIVLLGDETAAPAIARILEDLEGAGRASQATALIEVPSASDELEIRSQAHVKWLGRGRAPRGSRLFEELGMKCREHVPDSAPADADLLWETPGHASARSTAGDTPAAPGADAARRADTYYWVAGESGVVKQIRRFLVKDLGVGRRQVAFMGYWRLGVAMRG